MSYPHYPTSGQPHNQQRPQPNVNGYQSPYQAAPSHQLEVHSFAGHHAGSYHPYPNSDADLAYCSAGGNAIHPDLAFGQPYIPYKAIEPPATAPQAAPVFYSYQTVPVATSPVGPSAHHATLSPNPSSHPYQQAIDPRSLFSSESPLPAPIPAPAPLAPVTSLAPSAKVLLRIPRLDTVDMPSRNLPRASIKTEPIPYMTSRPQRGASQRAQQRISQAEDDDDEDDFEPDELIQPQEVYAQTSAAQAPYVDDGIRRSSRDRKPVQHYAGEDDFEDKLMETSPITRSSGRNKKKRIDPDSDDDGDDGDYAGGGSSRIPPRNAFPPRPSRISISVSGAGPNGAAAEAGPSYTNGSTANTLEPIILSTRRTTRGRPPASPAVKSRAGSADDAESFHPSGSEEEDDQSEDPLAGDYDEDEHHLEEDDLESRTPSPRPRRSTRASHRARRPPVEASRATLRRSTRRAAAESEEEDSYPARQRTLRARVPVNYRLPPADISTEITQADLAEGIAAASRPNGAARRTGVRFGAKWGGGGIGGVGGMGGRDLARAMGEDSSDSDDLLTPLKPSSAVAASGGGTTAGLVGGSKVTAPTDIRDFGRINPKSSTADADPLGVDMNVTFDNVGGLDGHIDQLKEMVALPLLYPEVFQQFGITPPRGVLFHGPPGTGKTLLARALAASCSNGNTKISFFMRKGADVLSKWVGEAERQLRMLFEEARAAQPSIIFFDEIDGLAPVRSSKQDQIHASLVSTLLALMDGMDGRGQVIVIGATNRPDSVDPALRRPGRFDREFYFPLPNKEARKKIIQINTRKWNPPLEEGLVEMLAGLTKGYGGADMRALCTEAALNAIQRRYPQIYRSTDRYELDTSSIQVKAKDFLMSVKKIVPSSARSTASTAISLPTHLVPILSGPLDRLKAAVDAVLPRHKDRTALEEAMFEEDEGDLVGAELLQTLDKMRTYRPRVLVSGLPGMGQTYLGPAILHHLEGFHVQNFDLGILLSDSTRTVEAALVQLFIEAKRHQPSIIYIPALVAWGNTLSDSAKATFKSLLDGILPSEPILLLGIAESSGYGTDIRSWFGYGGEGEVIISGPDEDARAEYFTPLITHIQTPPNMWPDAMPRRPRQFEQLKLAAPLAPRKPTDAELAKERERDLNARNMMVLSFTGLVSEFARKYKRVVASVKEDAFLLHAALVQHAAEQAALATAPTMESDVLPITAQSHSMLNGTTSLPIIQPTVPQAELPMSNSQPIPQASPIPPEASTPSAPAAAASTSGPTWTPYDIDTDALSRKLSKHKYHRPLDFLTDIDYIKSNADKLGDVDRQTKIAELVSHAYLHVAEFDPRWGPEFEAYAERMKIRREEREKGKGKEKEKTVDEGLEGESERGNLKRQREDGDVDMADNVDEQPGKRVRVDEPIQTADEGSSQQVAPNLDATATQNVATVPPPQSRVYPEFIVPLDKLGNLTQALRSRTADFNVEELEQLRAGLFDRIWKKRADWDRGALLDELSMFLAKMVRGVRARQST